MEFPRLYRQAIVRNSLVKDVATNNNFGVIWENVFSRKMLDREHCMVDNLKTMVGPCELNDDMEDRIVSIHKKGGVFSVKKLSHLLAYDGIEVVEFLFDRNWKLKAPPRVLNFMWMLVINHIPTKYFLTSRGI